MNSYKQIAIDTESGAWFGAGKQKGLGQDMQWKWEGTGSHEGWVEERLCLRKSKLSYEPQEERASPRAHHWTLP